MMTTLTSKKWSAVLKQSGIRSEVDIDSILGNHVVFTAGGSFQLTWSSTGATDCTASGGGANGTPWSGSIGTSGTLSQTASVAGSYTYSVVCNNGAQSTNPQSVTVVVAQQSSGGSSAAGSSHGGGALSDVELVLLSALLWLRVARKAAKNV